MARTKANTILFAIPRETYLPLRDSAVASRWSGDLADNVKFLSGVEWTRSLHQDLLCKLAFFGHRRVHPRGAVILQEGAGNSNPPHEPTMYPGILHGLSRPSHCQRRYRCHCGALTRCVCLLVQMTSWLRWWWKDKCAWCVATLVLQEMRQRPHSRHCTLVQQPQPQPLVPAQGLGVAKPCPPRLPPGPLCPS